VWKLYQIDHVRCATATITKSTSHGLSNAHLMAESSFGRHCNTLSHASTAGADTIPSLSKVTSTALENAADNAGSSGGNATDRLFSPSDKLPPTILSATTSHIPHGLQTPSRGPITPGRGSNFVESLEAAVGGFEGINTSGAKGLNSKTPSPPSLPDANSPLPGQVPEKHETPEAIRKSLSNVPDKYTDEAELDGVLRTSGLGMDR
jgi:hypothetical protein